MSYDVRHLLSLVPWVYVMISIIINRIRCKHAEMPLCIGSSLCLPTIANLMCLDLLIWNVDALLISSANFKAS